jgi:hypothetical protein
MAHRAGRRRDDGAGPLDRGLPALQRPGAGGQTADSTQRREVAKPFHSLRLGGFAALRWIPPFCQAQSRPIKANKGKTRGRPYPGMTKNDQFSLREGFAAVARPPLRGPFQIWLRAGRAGPSAPFCGKSIAVPLHEPFAHNPCK